MGLPRTYKTLEANTSLGRRKGEHQKDRYFPSLEEYLRRVEKNHILKILTKSCWNLSLAAEMLSISRPTLTNKIKLYDFEKPEINLSKRKMDYLIAGKIDASLSDEEISEAENYMKTDAGFKETYENALKVLKELEKENPTKLPKEIV
jgi:hypothetical protein